MARTVTFKGKPVELAGNELKPGDTAPAYTGLKGLDPVTLADTPAKARLFSVVPSLDTGVCSLQTKKFDDGVKALGDGVACYTVSLDLPFAQNRFCGAEGIDNLETISDYQDRSFGTSWGLLIDELKILARAVYVVDKDDTIVYAQVMDEMTSEPDYAAALAALRKIA